MQTATAVASMLKTAPISEKSIVASMQGNLDTIGSLLLNNGWMYTTLSQSASNAIATASNAINADSTKLDKVLAHC
jgi:hypothetical protein